MRDHLLCKLMTPEVRSVAVPRSKPVAYWERTAVLATYVFMQKITHGKRKFGSCMKYSDSLGVQSSDPCLRNCRGIFPVTNGPWSSAQYQMLPSLGARFKSSGVLWEETLVSTHTSWVKAFCTWDLNTLVMPKTQLGDFFFSPSWKKKKKEDPLFQYFFFW